MGILQVHCNLPPLHVLQTAVDVSLSSLCSSPLNLWFVTSMEDGCSRQCQVWYGKLELGIVFSQEWWSPVEQTGRGTSWPKMSMRLSCRVALKHCPAEWYRSPLTVLWVTCKIT